jgi:hypothetical protein
MCVIVNYLAIFLPYRSQTTFDDQTNPPQIQTKYTPYLSPNSDSTPESITVSVKYSIESSLHELRTAPGTSSPSPSTLDCLVLHSPLSTPQATLTAWRAMESFVPSRVTRLGISNTTLPLLSTLYSSATIKPSVVQNRFYANTGYDVPLRAFCRDHDITYQSFWTLTANPGLLKSRPVDTLSKEAKVSKEVALYHFVLQLGDVSMLNGTTSEEHMETDLEQVGQAQVWMEDGGNAEVWEKVWGDFRMLIGEVGS